MTFAWWDVVLFFEHSCDGCFTRDRRLCSIVAERTFNGLFISLKSEFQTSSSWVFKFELELSVTRLKSSPRVQVTRRPVTDRVTGTRTRKLNSTIMNPLEITTPHLTSFQLTSFHLNGVTSRRSTQFAVAATNHRALSSDENEVSFETRSDEVIRYQVVSREGTQEHTQTSWSSIRICAHALCWEWTEHQ